VSESARAREREREIERERERARARARDAQRAKDAQNQIALTCILYVCASDRGEGGKTGGKD